MQTPSRRLSLALLLFLFAPPVAAGEIAIAVTAASASGERSRVLVFDTSAPATFLADRPLFGLPTGETLWGLDLRPATGEIFLVASANRMLSLDIETGQLNQLAFPTGLPLASSELAISFNPAADRLRYVDAVGFNARFNPVSNQAVDSDPIAIGTQPDTSLAYIGGDPHSAASPHVIAAAYDRIDNLGTTATTLFVIDSELDILARQGAVDGNAGDVAGGGSPNGGLLTTLGPLGIDIGAPASLDIAGEGSAYLVAQVNGDTESTLFRVKLPPAEAGADVGSTVALGTFPGERIVGFALIPGGGIGNAPTLTEVDETHTEVVITVTRAGDTLAPAQVSYATFDRTAVAGKDYVAQAGQLFFDQGEASKSISVTLLPDTAVEGSETFGVSLGPVLGAVLLSPELTVEISDDERSTQGCACAGSPGELALAGVFLWALLLAQRKITARA